MDSLLPVVYLSILLTLLGAAAWVVGRQILKTRKVEMTLTRLQSQLNQQKGQGTVQEHYELGSIFLDKKLYSQAINQFQKALKGIDVDQEENLAPVYNALGFAHFAQQQYDLAIRNYKEALQVDPDYISALNNLGHAYELKQLTAQALEVYEQALSHDPKNVISKRRVESLRKRLVPSA